MWDWLLQEENRQVLTWLGGGLVAAVTGLWVVYTYSRNKSSETSSHTFDQSGQEVHVNQYNAETINQNYGLSFEQYKADLKEKERENLMFFRVYPTRLRPFQYIDIIPDFFLLRTENKPMFQPGTKLWTA